MKRAETRATTRRKLFGDATRGGFLDYNFSAGKHSTYEYATTLYTHAVGRAGPLASRRMQSRDINICELNGGIVMSRHETGVQWDYPYGWARLQLIAAEGLRNYKLDADADRISVEFPSTVMENFQRDGTMREKYNMVTGSSEFQVAAAYPMNVVGFGWTNGVFLALQKPLAK